MNNIDGFTGIDKMKTRTDIMNFDNEAAHTLYRCHQALDVFFGTLCVKWASPIAKTFTEDEEEKEEDVFESYWNKLEHIISGAYDAANILLSVNGEEELEKYINMGDYMFKIFPFHLCTCKEETDEGHVGMDTEGVRIALEAFKTEYSSALDCIDNLPEGISFYDKEGKLVDTYNRSLKNFKDLFSVIFSEVATKMEGYVNTEADNIELAKAQAVSTMSA